MGSITYDGAVIEFDDRLLTHLHVVVMQLFRRDESFPFSWIDAPQVGEGRSSVWLTPTQPIYFKFNGSRVPSLNRSWLDRLHASASSSKGLVALHEDGSPARATARVRRATD